MIVVKEAKKQQSKLPKKNSKKFYTVLILYKKTSNSSIKAIGLVKKIKVMTDKKVRNACNKGQEN